MTGQGECIPPSLHIFSCAARELLSVPPTVAVSPLSLSPVSHGPGERVDIVPCYIAQFCQSNLLYSQLLLLHERELFFSSRELLD